jgi:hypothetical protein
MIVLRRSVTVPLVTALMGGVLVSGPLLLAVAGLVGLASRPTRMPTRNQSRPPCARVSAATAGVPRV